MAANSTITDLDAQLASLNQLKPPGASKNRIGSITQLCVNNIQVESNICQSLYRALKKAPSTHKLGALYVIDSVVRQWIEKAKQSGQDLQIEGRGEPGTFPAAVKRVTELIPALFDDTLRDIPAEQKPKLDNMINIWEKGSTFPPKTLADFRVKLRASAPANPAYSHSNGAPSGEKFSAPVPSRPLHTPVGFPPQHLYDQGLLPTKGGVNAQGAAASSQLAGQVRAPASAPSDVNSILAALANAVPKPAPVPAPSALTPQIPSSSAFPQPVQNQALPPQLPPEFAAMLGQQGAQQPNVSAAFPAVTPNTFPPFPQQPNYSGFPPPQTSSVPQQYGFAPPPATQPAPVADPLAPLRGILPQSIVNDHSKLVMALSLLQDLQKQGLPMDQWGPILKAFEESSAASQPAVPTAGPSSGFNPAYSTPEGYGRGRDRSRSPDRAGRRGGRGSPVYGSYDDISSRGGNEGSDRDRYRQRSPVGARNSPGNQQHGTEQGMQPKYIAVDNSLPPNNIKVLSRTLFVGGANGTQNEIQSLFERYGRVQTCIANRDKRHAFVKMTTRASALAAKAGMEELQSRSDPAVMHIARQTKWGVGFGPRECCDYQRGESIIPIHKLTEADMKWLLTAEYGGTGGKNVEGGMVVEEPDIEIGAGVSSKAMSKRVGPEHHSNPKRGGREERRGGGFGASGGHGGGASGGGGGGYGRKGRDLDGAYVGNNGGFGAANGGGPPPSLEGFYPRPEPVAVATPPAVPTFGFSLPTSGFGNPGAGAGYR